MAALSVGRTEIGIKEFGSGVIVPTTPVAKLMYYFHCVCSCLEIEQDAEIRRLKNYQNQSSLSSEDEEKLIVLCLALSPDKLIGAIFIPSEDIPYDNDFYEVSAVSTRMVVTESILVGGQRKRIRKVMMFRKCWIEENYLEPMKVLVERRRAIQRPPPPRRETSSCTIS